MQTDSSSISSQLSRIVGLKILIDEKLIEIFWNVMLGDKHQDLSLKMIQIHFLTVVRFFDIFLIQNYTKRKRSKKTESFSNRFLFNAQSL